MKNIILWQRATIDLRRIRLNLTNQNKSKGSLQVITSSLSKPYLTNNFWGKNREKVTVRNHALVTSKTILKVNVNHHKFYLARVNYSMKTLSLLEKIVLKDQLYVLNFKSITTKR